MYQTTIGEAASQDQHICYEFQRCNILSEWGSDYPGHLLPTDPGRYCSQAGQNFSMKFDDVMPPVPPGWEVAVDWRVVSTVVCLFRSRMRRRLWYRVFIRFLSACIG